MILKENNKKSKNVHSCRLSLFKILDTDSATHEAIFSRRGSFGTYHHLSLCFVYTSMEGLGRDFIELGIS